MTAVRKGWESRKASSQVTPWQEKSLISFNENVFKTMIMSWALLARGVNATADDSCDDASLHAVCWMMAGCLR